jgi:hypothetical protein
LTTNESFNAFGINETLPPSESFPPFTENDTTAKEKPFDAYDMKPVPSVPDPSPFQEISSQETSFNAVFELPEKTATSPFDVQEPHQLDCTSTSMNAISEPFPESAVTENDAFDAFAAKFDDSQVDCNTTGFDAFGSVSEGAFEDSSIGFGADDNFDSFLSTHQIPAAPQSTPAKVTRNNSGESLDENDFNVFIRYLICSPKYIMMNNKNDYLFFVLDLRQSQVILINPLCLQLLLHQKCLQVYSKKELLLGSIHLTKSQVKQILNLKVNNSILMH